MNQSISEILQEIKSLNDITLKGEIVIFGSDYMADFPFYELINHYQIENAVYNRSIAGLTLADAAQALQDCVLAIKPAKIFLAFGEHDAENPDAFTRYKGILHCLRTELPAAKLHVIGLPGELKCVRYSSCERRRYLRTAQYSARHRYQHTLP